MNRITAYSFDEALGKIIRTLTEVVRPAINDPHARFQLIQAITLLVQLSKLVGSAAQNLRGENQALEALLSAVVEDARGRHPAIADEIDRVTRERLDSVVVRDLDQRNDDLQAVLAMLIVATQSDDGTLDPLYVRQLVQMNADRKPALFLLGA